MNKLANLFKSKAFKITAIAVVCAAVIAGAIALVLSLRPSGLEEAEIKAIYADLIPRSQELNEILWGAGLEVVSGAEAVESVSAAQYYPVADSAKYQSLAELKGAVAEVFSSGYYDIISSALFEEITDEKDEMFNVYPRYIERDGLLSNDITYKSLQFSTIIDIDSMEVVKDRYNSISAEFDYTMKNGEISGKMTVKLALDGKAWRIDSPTY